MMPETLPVVNPAGTMSPASRTHLERRWEMEEVHNRLLAKSQEIDRQIAAERHSAWFASCREVLWRRAEHLRHTRDARLIRLRTEGRCLYTEEANEALVAFRQHARAVQRNIGQAEMRASRLAMLNKLADARADAHGWGVMTVIDSSVADTILDSMSEPPALFATGGVQADTMLDSISATS